MFDPDVAGASVSSEAARVIFAQDAREQTAGNPARRLGKPFGEELP